MVEAGIAGSGDGISGLNAVNSFCRWREWAGTSVFADCSRNRYGWFVARNRLGQVPISRLKAVLKAKPSP